MVVTKIESGEYSIVTASGLKFNAMKQRNHYWTVQNDSLGIIAGYPTLKECEEWADKQVVEKPADDEQADCAEGMAECGFDVDKEFSEAERRSLEEAKRWNRRARE